MYTLFREKICLCCNSKFLPNRSDQLFCSVRCRKKYHQKSYLVLPIKKKWFDMILSRKKIEEYREIKPYWHKRFNKHFGQHYDFSREVPSIIWNQNVKTIIFRNGYGKNAPELHAECTIREDYGKIEWGAKPNQKYYVLTIHRILNTDNTDKKNFEYDGLEMFQKI